MFISVQTPSPVDAKQKPYLAQWDNCVRKYHDYFENYKLLASAKVHALKNDKWTSWRDPIQLRDRYTEVDNINLRQMLGDISHDEVAELNRVLGSRYHFSKGWNQPAKLLAWDKPALLFLSSVSGAFTIYGLAVLKSNILWLGATPLIIGLGMAINYGRQDQEAHQNAYRYLLAKRAAIAEYEANRASITQNARLSTLLNTSGSTLYDLEQQIVSQIIDNKF